MDFRDFLQTESSSLRLPYFGGRSVCDDQRTYRLRETISPGWYRFTESGRYLQVEETIDPEPEAWQLKSASGYLVDRHFIDDESRRPIYDLPADEELPRFTPVQAWLWFDGHLLFGGSEFESEPELQVREAYEDERNLESIKGVKPALAHAFLLTTTARALAREAERRRREEEEQRQYAERIERWQRTLEGRIALALSHTGAELIDWRQSATSQATIRYRVGRQRLECVIDTGTLQILDAGICLEGTDQELNLSSLPSAVREAIDSGELHIFRHF